MTEAQQIAAVEKAFTSAERYSRDWWTAGIAKVLQRWGDKIVVHQLDLPTRVVAARIWWETRGNPKVVSSDPVLQETGLLQLSRDSQAQYGVTDPTDPDQNLRAGCLLWSRWWASFRAWALAAQLALDPSSSRDAFTMAWLVTAIGPGAIRDLSKAAQSARYQDVSRWVVEQAPSYFKLHASGRLGRATAETTASRIAIAGLAMAAAVEKDEGAMSITSVVILLLLCLLSGFAVFWFAPRLGM